MTTQTQLSIPDLSYKVLPLSKVKVRGISEQHRLKCDVMLQNDWYHTTDRFWTSFFAKFGFSDSVFKYFKHQEVFDRICQKHQDVELRFCVDSEAESTLAVSNPAKPVIRPESMNELLRKYKAEDVKYQSGFITSVHTPNSGIANFKIGPDSFYNRYTLDTPLDGYGKPSIYLMLLREICSNGAIGIAPAFRSDITIGDEPPYAISRALDSFDSDEGYSAMRQRFSSAQLAPASLSECLGLFKTFKAMKDDKAIEAYEKVVGDIYDTYGVANLDGISEKRLRLLPAKCKVYDLLNLTSEVATHHAEPESARRLQAWIGMTLSAEFDLEGTNSKKEDGFQPTFLSPKEIPGRLRGRMLMHRRDPSQN
jgi:hypothetical protein